MLNLSKTSFLICITFIGCGAPSGRMEYLTQSDGRGKVNYETVAELQDTLAAWGYPNAMALKMPDSVRANFPYSFKLYLVNEHLEIHHEVCEAFFPNLKKKIDLAEWKRFDSPDRYVKSLLAQSSTLDGRNLLEVISENRKEHRVQAIIITGFYKKFLFDDRIEELKSLIQGDLLPVYCVHTLQFSDADLSHSDFLTIQYKYFEDTGDKLPQEAYDRLDSIRSAEAAQIID